MRGHAELSTHLVKGGGALSASVGHIGALLHQLPAQLAIAQRRRLQQALWRRWWRGAARRAAIFGLATSPLPVLVLLALLVRFSMLVTAVLAFAAHHGPRASLHHLDCYVDELKLTTTGLRLSGNSCRALETADGALHAFG